MVEKAKVYRISSCFIEQLDGAVTEDSHYMKMSKASDKAQGNLYQTLSIRKVLQQLLV